MAISGEGRPRFWIVAGPNGSGKSTAYGRGDVAGLDGSVWIINPDLLTVRLRDAERLSLVAANLAAVQRIETWLDASLEVHQTIGVETVLSSSKYRRLVEKAKTYGFEVCFVFVFLRDAELQLNVSGRGWRRAVTMYRQTRYVTAERDLSIRPAGFLGRRTGRGCSTTPRASLNWLAARMARERASARDCLRS